MKLVLIDALIGNDYSVCLAEALNAEGIELFFICPSNRKFKSSYNFTIYKWMPSKDPGETTLSKLISYPVFLFKTVRLIRKFKNTIVHFQFFRFKTDIFFLAFLSLIGAKTVYTAHNIFPHERKKSDLWLNYILYKSAGRIIVHSETIKKKLLSNFNIKPEKTTVVPHGNFDIYLPQQLPTQCEARQIFNLTAGDKVLLFFGYIKEYKGLDLLLKSFKMLNAENSDIKLIIAGYPATRKLWESYNEIIDSIKNKSNIILKLNFIPAEEIASYFLAADFVVLPYKRIDHSGIVHLAYSFNTPVIATNVGDFSEIIENEKSGYIVKPDDIQDLAVKIETAFAQKYKTIDMTNYIKQLNRTRYSWEEAAKKSIRVYESF